MLQKLTNILKSEDITIQQSLQIMSYFKRMNILDENEKEEFEKKDPEDRPYNFLP